MKKITDYKIRIGDFLNYVDGVQLYPVIITDIIFDGFVFLIEFKHDDVFNKTRGVTQYPDRLKQR